MFDDLKNNFNLKAAIKIFDEIILSKNEQYLNQFLTEYLDQLLKADPIITIGKHVHFYLQDDLIDEALEVLKKYQDGPFINLTTEEFMKELREEILKQTKSQTIRVYDSSKLESDLFSNREERIVRAIRYLSDNNIRSYFDLVGYVLKSKKIKYKFKILIQFILIEQEVNKPVCIVKDDGTEFILYPDKTLLPFQTDDFKQCLTYIQTANEAPTILKNAEEVLKSVQVKNFPESIISLADNPSIAGELFIAYSKKMLMEMIDFQVLMKDTLMDEEDINSYLKKISLILSE